MTRVPRVATRRPAERHPPDGYRAAASAWQKDPGVEILKEVLEQAEPKKRLLLRSPWPARDGSP